METISIIKAEYVGNLSVKIRFDDDTVRVIDVGAFIRQHPHNQYNKYLQEKNFLNFKIENGNIVWGDDWDLIFPIEQLYAGKIQ
jgi:hypothetical protein